MNFSRRYGRRSDNAYRCSIFDIALCICTHFCCGNFVQSFLFILEYGIVTSLHSDNSHQTESFPRSNTFVQGHVVTSLRNSVASLNSLFFYQTLLVKACHFSFEGFCVLNVNWQPVVPQNIYRITFINIPTKVRDFNILSFLFPINSQTKIFYLL